MSRHATFKFMKAIAMRALHIVILAAGRGKRMVSDVPKVLHPIGGRPMLAHVLEAARSLLPASLTVVYGHGGDQVKQAFAHDTDLNWAQQTEQLGTGHALKMALPYLSRSGQTLVLYGDVPLIQADTLSRLVEAAGDELGLLTDHLAQPTGYGRIVRDADGHIQRIVEEKDASDAEKALTEINTGILVLPNTHLSAWLDALGNQNAQGEYYLTDVIALAVRDGLHVHGQTVPASWQAAGVNNKAQLAALERCYQQQQASALFDAGVTLADPARIDVRGHIFCDRDVFIDVNCVFEGEVTLGEGVTIGANCVLRNVSIAAHSRVEPFSHLDGAYVGEFTKIGPYARLRPGARLGNHVHIGNFVEVKNSVLADGAKANHLTYLGDADIGQQVNVGAGTVTCNYDGVNKFRTQIGDRAFIGSGSMLVAPVDIGEDATIAAGSVVTKSAPAGQLTVSRAKQISITSWKRPIKAK